MEVKGFIRKAEAIPPSGDKKGYMRYSVVENWGKKDDPNQFSTWYTVRAYSLDELSRELLVVGSFVKVVGKLRAYPYESEGTQKAGLDLMAVSIEPAELRA